MSAQEPQGRGALLPPWWILVRDVGSFVLGWGLAVWEVSGDARESVLLFCAGVVGVPALVNGAQTVASAVSGRSGTGSQSEPPAPDPQPASSQ